VRANGCGNNPKTVTRRLSWRLQDLHEAARAVDADALARLDALERRRDTISYERTAGW